MTAVQTAEGSNPGALRRGGASGASEPWGAAGTFQPCPAHQEATDQVQVQLLIRRTDSLTPWLTDSFTTNWHPPASTATSQLHCWTSAAWTRFCSSRRRSWTCPTFWPPRHHRRAGWWQVGGAWRWPESPTNPRRRQHKYEIHTWTSGYCVVLTLRSICLQPEMPPWTEEKHLELQQHNLLHSDSHWTNKITVCPSRLSLHT